MLDVQLSGVQYVRRIQAIINAIAFFQTVLCTWWREPTSRLSLSSFPSILLVLRRQLRSVRRQVLLEEGSQGGVVHRAAGTVRGCHGDGKGYFGQHVFH